MIVLEVHRQPETGAQQGAPDERPWTSGRRDDVFFWFDRNTVKSGRKVRRTGSCGTPRKGHVEWIV